MLFILIYSLGVFIFCIVNLTDLIGELESAEEKKKNGEDFSKERMKILALILQATFRPLLPLVVVGWFIYSIIFISKK